MKVRRGKKAKYLVCAETGLLKDSAWKHTLEGYPTVLVCSIRKELARRIPGLSEKFNRKSRYFGYWTGTDNDRSYIFVQKKVLRIDLCISRKFEIDLRKEGFKVKYVNNFQGRARWLTGWQVSQTTLNVEPVFKWLDKAFK